MPLCSNPANPISHQNITCPRWAWGWRRLTSWYMPVVLFVIWPLGLHWQATKSHRDIGLKPSPKSFKLEKADESNRYTCLISISQLWQTTRSSSWPLKIESQTSIRQLHLPNGDLYWKATLLGRVMYDNFWKEHQCEKSTGIAVKLLTRIKAD